VIALHALAPGKVNLSLVLGGARRDGRHELVTLIQSVSLADALTLRAAGRGAGGDRVVCAGIEGPNLAEEALRAYREATGWDAPPLELHIDKRVPIAAGMGGGSADAAAALRLAVAASGDPDGAAAASRIAPALGSDVPSQLEPGVVLGTGAGERVRRAAPRRAHGLVIVPSAERLSTAEVYREADRLGLARPAAEVAEWRAAL
jgi:4-diphosphocytidyl-2-C-methyl-D-erythritol kinase